MRDPWLCSSVCRVWRRAGRRGGAGHEDAPGRAEGGKVDRCGDAARNRAIQLRDHVAGHLRTRSESLDAPVVVLLLGPTGAGKSTLFNTIAGRAASPTGVLRPTTRTAIVLAHPH